MQNVYACRHRNEALFPCTGTLLRVTWLCLLEASMVVCLGLKSFSVCLPPSRAMRMGAADYPLTLA